MQRKRARSESEGEDHQADTSRLKRQVRHRCSPPLQLSSPPLESIFLHESGSAPSPHRLRRDQHNSVRPPLTRDNLRRLQRSLRTSTMPSSPSRASRSPDKSSTGDKLDSKDKLQLFSIFYDEQTPVPDLLREHISGLRRARLLPSPNAKRIQETAPMARAQAEQDGIDEIEKVLLIPPAKKGGAPYVERAAKANLNSRFVPPATSVVAEGLRLETPQPDHCFGYLPSKKAKPAKLKHPFETEEEDIINKFNLTSELYFPFLTVQWKSPAKGQTHHQAIPQGARDGATIVNYLHEYYATARPQQAPTMIETCHFSATIDLRSVILWVHWREQDENGKISYHMEQVESGMLDKERDNKEIRAILRNLQDHALGERLQGIKALLRSFWGNFAKSGPPARVVTIASSSSSVTENIPPLRMPTPSSEGVEGRKRKRGRANGSMDRDGHSIGD